MWLCSHCGSENLDGSICANCKKDDGKNYERYMTLIKLSDETCRTYSGYAHPEKLISEGLLYFFGNGRVQDYDKAAELFFLAAKHNDGRALYYAGLCCQWGLGIEKNDEKACAYFKDAFLYGYTDAIVSIGDFYYYGRGSKKDERMAAVWYRKGAEAGIALAQMRYAKCLKDGCGVTKSLQEAQNWYGKAAMQGNADAIEIFSRFHNTLGQTEAEPKEILIEKSEYLSWTDKVFEHLVSLALHLPQGKIRMKDIKDIEILRIDGNKISFGKGESYDSTAELLTERIHSLKDIEWFLGLRYLQIHGHHIKKLDGLEKSVLVNFVSLNGNSIEDISAIRPLINLKELYLNNNVIEDIQPISTLKKLERLDLSNNKIMDIKPLENMSVLVYLQLSGNKIRDIGMNSLTHLKNMRGLFVGNAGITNIQAIEVLKKLVYLDLSDNQISDMTPLIKLPALCYLGLKGNKAISYPSRYMFKSKRRNVKIYETDSTDQFDFKHLT